MKKRMMKKRIKPKAFRVIRCCSYYIPVDEIRADLCHDDRLFDPTFLEFHIGHRLSTRFVRSKR